MKRLCQPSGTIYLDPTSRFSHLPELLLKQDLNAVQDLVENGSFYESLEGNRIRRHEFEIKELLALLWDEGLTVVTIVGRSTLLGILGQAGMLKLLEDHEMGKLFEMEDYLSQNEALNSLARHFEAVCRVS